MTPGEGGQETQRRCARLYSWVSPDALVAPTHASELSHKVACVCMCCASLRFRQGILSNTAVQGMAIHTTPSLLTSDQCSKHNTTVHETPADLNYCLTTSVCVKCMHSYTFNTEHVSSKTVRHAADHEMHMLVAHPLQPSSG